MEAHTPGIAPPISSIPKNIKAFQKVFSTNLFTMLPVHCSGDCEIRLEDGKDIPYGSMYPMNPSKTAPLKDHIDSELAAGNTHPSTSPAGTPVIQDELIEKLYCA
ncbi:hypothetical protein BN14_07484 [Rhizoctonia solani AG-1 IB]|uniref:Uncharacterized protein n=1 Tax=Thanatephorus cucumeris (strain AG1-IB / isolate 7/3/14) TaxID=1108050 RepID=M5C1Z1_THACB|nr:hypothetical protein BN14_07484 [Rhizoctonia solani AG-1 IB]